MRTSTDKSIPWLEDLKKKNECIPLRETTWIPFHSLGLILTFHALTFLFAEKKKPKKLNETLYNEEQKNAVHTAMIVWTTLKFKSTMHG